MARIITTNLDDILDLIVNADSYCFDHPILIGTCFKFIGELSDEEIKEYAESYITPGSDYTKEDVEDITDTLTKLRDKYFK